MKQGRRIQSVQSLPVEDIETVPRLRPISEPGVAALIASIETLGVMQHPVQVRRQPHKGGRLVLMAGAHRLEAAKRLGWAEIPAALWEGADAWAAMMEIDDNLAGAELTPLDSAVFLAERKRVYEAAFPQTRQGGDRGNQHTGGRQTDIMSFCQTTAEKFGLSERHVRRMVAAGEGLDAGILELLRSADRPIRLTDLQAVAKIADKAERTAAARRFATGHAKSIGEAAKQLRAPKPERSENDRALDALLAAWSRAPKRARRGFVETVAPEIAALLPQEHGS